MSRFVILEHDHPALHWDFMLEHGPALKTWRLGSFPGAGRDVAATAISDHRLAYLDYEGPVSGERGKVIRRDQGTYAVLEGDLEKAEPLVLDLHGSRIRGIVVLRPQLAQDIAQHADAWNFHLRET